MNQKNLRSILARITKLEVAVFGNKKRRKVIPQKIITKDFSGITGGIRFLISKGFFKTRKYLLEIRKDLVNNGYHSSIQAVQTALNRLSKSNGPLIAFKEGHKKVYAQRK